MGKSKLGRKIFLIMVICTLGISSIIFAISFYTANRMQSTALDSEKDLGNLSSEICGENLLSQMETTIVQLTKAKADNQNIVFKRIETEVKGLCETLTNIYSDPSAHAGYIPPYPAKTLDGVIRGRGALVKGTEATEKILEEQKLISAVETSGSTVYANDRMLRMILVGSESGVFYRYSNYNSYNEVYDARKREWYINAMSNPDTVVWSNAYIEAYGNLVVTCSRTYRDGEGNLAGVIACDISISSLLDEIKSGDASRGNYAFIIDRNGDYVAHPSYSSEGFIKNPIDEGNEEKSKIIKKMMNGETGVGQYDDNGSIYYLSYAYIPTTGWSYAIVTSKDSVLAPVNKTSEVIKKTSEESQLKMQNLLTGMRTKFNTIFVLCIIVVGIAAYLLTRTIVKPVEKMVKGAELIGEGDLEYRLEVKGDDELAHLSDSFNKMTENLRQYINDLTKVTAEKHRIGAELNVATKIQADMLPGISPTFSDRKEFAIYASMNPAKEVGGDFYDFFMIDDKRLALVIADVSGKGVPAALFMVIAKTLIKNQAQMTSEVNELLEIVNNQLCETNGAEMFVTVWMGIIDTTTGHMECSNAGHEFPFIRKRDGKFEVIQDKHGFVLGGMDGIKLKKYTIDLEEGDTIFVYTDGAPEANNINGEMFGMERLEDALNSLDNPEPINLVKKIKASVDEFKGEAEQFDDLTMLCYKQLKVSEDSYGKGKI